MTKPAEQRDRAIGALVGLAVGDALGTTLEFVTRDSVPLHDTMAGGGPFGLKPGQWTDDTAMALALADNILDNDGLDETDLLGRFSDWHRAGLYSCTGTCFDIGNTVRAALHHWQETGNPRSGPTAPETAGNGSIMRLAPVAIRYWNDAEKMENVACRQSMTTHGASESVEACVLLGRILADSIASGDRQLLLRPREGDFGAGIAAVAAGTWQDKARSDIRGSGYVVESLEAALWSVRQTGGFREAVVMAANLGEDADTTAAVAGQIAGALYGFSAIPSDFLEPLAWRESLVETAERLYERSIA